MYMYIYVYTYIYIYTYTYIHVHVKETYRKTGSIGRGKNRGRDSPFDCSIRGESRVDSASGSGEWSGVDRVEGIGRSGVSIVGEGRVDRPDQWRRGWP